MCLLENCYVDIVPSCSANPFGSGKDKNEEFHRLTVLQNTSRDFVIACRILQSHALFAILPVCCSIAVNSWRVKLWQILQLAKFAKVFHYMVYALTHPQGSHALSHHSWSTAVSGPHGLSTETFVIMGGPAGQSMAATDSSLAPSGLSSIFSPVWHY